MIEFTQRDRSLQKCLFYQLITLFHLESTEVATNYDVASQLMHMLLRETCMHTPLHYELLKSIHADLSEYVSHSHWKSSNS